MFFQQKRTIFLSSLTMVRVRTGRKRVLAVALLSAACSVLSAQDNLSEEIPVAVDIERLPAPEFPVDRPRSRIVACRALPALHTQPQGEVSVVVLPAPAPRPAGSLCVRVYNRTQDELYRMKSTLYVEQHLRAQLWRRSRYRPYTESDYETGCPGILLRTDGVPWEPVPLSERLPVSRPPESAPVRVRDSVPCMLIHTKSEDFFEGYLPYFNPLPGVNLALTAPVVPTLQPGRYRVCVQFWQGNRASWAGWEEWPDDWLLTLSLIHI